MNLRGLVLRGFAHFRTIHLGIVLGVAIGSAVLTGALLVGDSVRIELRKQALLRIGRVDLALEGGERLFEADLARRIGRRLEPATVAPALVQSGVASTADGRRRALGVRLLGVEESFFELAPERSPGAIPDPDEVFLGEPLARRLGAAIGDRVLFRVQPLAAMPEETLLGDRVAGPQALSLRVARVVADGELGRFGLTAAPLPADVAFVDLAWLQQRLGAGARANLLLVGGDTGTSVEAAQRALAEAFTLEDLGVRARELEGSGGVELRSDAILFEPPIAAALERVPGPSLGVLTWLANDLRAGERSAPYSMVTALGPASAGGEIPAPWRSILPEGIADEEIVVNEWLASDLDAAAGDEVELAYWRLERGSELVEERRTFEIAAVVPLEGAAADREWTPPFPGIAESGTCAEWEIDLPIDTARIRDADEAYWEAHGATPKAFVTLAAGEAMWGDDRFGSLTAVRVERERGEAFLRTLRAELDPAELGLAFRDVRTPALAASSPATDFGGLFLGLSFFLLGSAFLLVGLLFSLGVLQRSSQIGTLLAVGFRPGRIRGLLLAELSILAVVGALAGVVLAAGYAEGVILALDTIWQDAVAGASLASHVRPGVLAVGALGTSAAAILVARLALRRRVGRPAVELLAARAGVESDPPEVRRRRRRLSLVVALVAFHGWMAAESWCVSTDGPAKPAAAFVAGTLALIAALALCRRALLGGAKEAPLGFSSLTGLALSNARRRPARSLATVLLIATAAFLVLIVGAFRKVLPDDPFDRASGTGGFALFGRSSLGVVPEHASSPIGGGFRFTGDQPAEIRVVPLRWMEGDEASCLNLARPQRPSLLGVEPAELAERGAFSFDGVLGEGEGNPWELLSERSDPGVVPAIGDSAGVTWSLHKALGDSVPFVDERGREIEVKIVATLAGSILQGDLIIDEARFREHFPSESGYRAFLVDGPPGEVARWAPEWNRRLSDAGLALAPAVERLRELGAVQNTYLLVFQMLGGLGLLLGTIGLGVVVARNVDERRGELAVLGAVGFPARRVRAMLLLEHGALLLGGVLCGTIGALAAVVPLLGAEGGTSPLFALAAVPAAMAACGAFWVWLASRLAWRRPLLEVLARAD